MNKRRFFVHQAGIKGAEAFKAPVNAAANAPFGHHSESDGHDGE